MRKTVKKAAKICVVILSVVGISGCKANDKESVISTKEEPTTVVEETGEETEIASDTPEIKKADGVDVDLTALSSTMVYAEVFNMVLNPKEYIGKTVKARGAYSVGYDEAAGAFCHFVIISDATECCAQGLEFVWDNNQHVYPDEYPEENTEVEITGVFSANEDTDGNTYYYLATDQVSKG